jgi:hypothetical protein
MLRFFTLLLCLLSSLWALPTTRTLSEKEYSQYIEKIRTRNFSDREVDRLHQSVAGMVSKIYEMVAKGAIKNAARYNDQVPTEEEILFIKDKDGKEYFVMFLGQGVTHEDYPIYKIYDTRVFIYPTDDKKTISKIIVQFNSVNSTPPIYIKEMRRIINPTPLFPGPPKVEVLLENEVLKWQQENVTDANVAGDDKGVGDGNGDIYVEYYTDHDSKVNWVDKTPETESKIGLTEKLNDPAKLLPFDVQKKIYLTYRDIMREVDSKIKAKLHILELNERRTIHKIMEFN